MKYSYATVELTLNARKIWPYEGEYLIWQVKQHVSHIIVISKLYDETPEWEDDSIGPQLLLWAAEVMHFIDVQVIRTHSHTHWICSKM